MGFENAVIIMLTILGVLLAAVGIVLAVFAFLIGVMAWWGFNEMKGYIRKTAEKHADATLSEKLAE